MTTSLIHFSNSNIFQRIFRIKIHLKVVFVVANSVTFPCMLLTALSLSENWNKLIHFKQFYWLKQQPIEIYCNIINDFVFGTKSNLWRCNANPITTSQQHNSINIKHIYLLPLIVIVIEIQIEIVNGILHNLEYLIESCF